MKSIWFEAQTGRIENADWSSNFHHYELPAGAHEFLVAAVSEAKIGSGGLEYPKAFLKAVEAQSERWVRRGKGLNRW